MRLITTALLTLLLATGCGSTPASPVEDGIHIPAPTPAPIQDALPEEFDFSDFEQQVSQAPACSEVAYMVAEIASLGCLSDDGQTIYAFVDFGCGAYSDAGGGLYGEEFDRDAVFTGCPTD